MGGGGKASAAIERGERLSEGTGSDGEMWEAEGRHRQRQREVGGGGKAETAIGRGGRRRRSTGSDSERQREGTGSDREWWEGKGRHMQR